MSFPIYNVDSYAQLQRFIAMDLAGTLPTRGDALVVNVKFMTKPEAVRKLQNAYVLGIDFDKTITDGVVSFEAMRGLVDEECAREDAQTSSDYFATSIPDHESCVPFMTKPVGLMVKSGVTRQVMSETVIGISPRHGALEFMRTFAARRCAVITFGIADFVELWFGRHGPSVDVDGCVHGLRLQWDKETGLLLGCDPATAVTDFTKGDRFLMHCAARGAKPYDAIALGDSPKTDVRMLHEAMHRGGLGILLMPRTERDAIHATSRNGDALRDAFDSIGAFLFSDSLMPLVGLRRGIEDPMYVNHNC